MKTARKMNLQELKSLGREMAWTRGKWRVLLLLRLILIVIGVILGFWSIWATEVLGVNEKLFENGAHIIIKIIELIMLAMLIPLFLGWAKKEDLGLKDFWSMFTKKVTRKIFVAIVLLSAGIFGLVTMAAFLAGLAAAFVPIPHAMTISMGSFMALAVIAVVVLSVRFSFVNQAIADKDLSVIEGFKSSWRITKGHFWKLIGFNCYFLLWNILGVLCLIIGLVWTATMRNIAISKLYLELSENEKNTEKSE